MKRGVTMKNNNQIDSLVLKNYGMIESFNCDNFSNINLIIGKNGTGKTFLLKSLYTAVKTIEEYRRGDDIKTSNEILAEKIRWTFQTEKLGDIVLKSSTNPLEFSMKFKNQSFSYKFSKDATVKINTLENKIGSKDSNSIFIPAKEVLSLFNIILKSREIDKSFGFDDTYYDLVKALRITPKQGKNHSAFAKSRKILEEIIDGKVDFDSETNKWYYKKGNQKFSIGATSEGIKKISILDRLLANKYLDSSSIIFIDELESALHPSAIYKLLEMIDIIANEMGIQVFIASHSYFVIKKLYLISQKRNQSITCISLDQNSKITISDLNDGLPNNSIINESIRLYEEEIREVL